MHEDKAQVLEQDNKPDGQSIGVRAMDSTNKFIVLGVLTRTKVVDRDAAGMLFIAWRCLYAEVVAARLLRAEVCGWRRHTNARWGSSSSDSRPMVNDGTTGSQPKD